MWRMMRFDGQERDVGCYARHGAHINNEGYAEENLWSGVVRFAAVGGRDEGASLCFEVRCLKLGGGIHKCRT